MFYNEYANFYSEYILGMKNSINITFYSINSIFLVLWHKGARKVT